MLQRVVWCLLALLLFAVTGCEETKPDIRIGASFGVGGSPRWYKEIAIMEERAKELGITFEARLNKTDKPKTQLDDCRELIDSGISVLILVPRGVNKVEEILGYAKQHNVKVISYARAVMGESVELFVGYDSYRIGQLAGAYLVEKVPAGDIIMLKGEAKDFNTPLLYQGGMTSVLPLVKAGKLRIILDDFVPSWSAATAKDMVKKAVLANGGRVDGIFASNDGLAGAAVAALQELGTPGKVVVTGMDADLPALRRIARGTQDATIFMDLPRLARSAIDEAYNMAKRNKSNRNAAVDNQSATSIDAYLINGKLVTRETMEKVIIEPRVYEREEIYAE